MAAPHPPNSLAITSLVTHEDLEKTLISILRPLLDFASPQGALIRLGQTATHYDETAAQLEGYARPLWGLASYISGGGTYENSFRWISGLIAGTDPSSPEYWGEVRDKDQRMVEMAPMGFWLATCGSSFLGQLGKREKGNIEAWFGSVNSREVSFLRQFGHQVASTSSPANLQV
jgi:hypothetical protein